MLFAELLLRHNADAAQYISDSWNLTWQLAFDGEIFFVLTRLGITISVICLSFLIVRVAQAALIEAGPQLGGFLVQQLTWPIIAIIMFSNNGAMMKSTCFFLRDFINQMNIELIQNITSEDGNVSFDGALAQVADFDIILDQITALRKQCDTFIKVDELGACLEEVEAMSHSLRDQYIEQYPDASEWVKVLDQQIELNAENPLTIHDTGGHIYYKNRYREPDEKGSWVARNITSAGEQLAKGLLIALQIAIQHVAEVSMLLTSLTLPVALAISLFPSPMKPITTWFSGLMSIGMFKISYNIIVGLVAISITRANIGPTNTLPLTLTLSILAPILAFGIASGGGIALMNGIGQASNIAASAGLGFSSSAMSSTWGASRGVRRIAGRGLASGGTLAWQKLRR